MKKSKNILEYYYLKYLNFNVHVGYKWIYIEIAADWYTNDINKELGLRKTPENHFRSTSTWKEPLK